MKGYIISFILLGPLSGFGQMKSHDWSIGGTYSYVQFQEFKPKNAFGVTGEYMFSKRWSVEFSVAGGKDYFEFGTGGIFFPLGLLLSKTSRYGDDSDKGLLLLLMAVACAFEHTNYHIPLSSNLELIPYVSILRIRYIYDNEHPYNQNTFPSWSIGTKLRLYTKNNWYFSTTVEGGQFYYPGVPKGLQAGVDIGYIIKSRIE